MTIKLFGVDISEHNGNVDFERMKASGVKYVMLRTSWGHFAEDKMIRRNVQKCKEAGLPYGFYHYSYADNDQNAKEEATKFLALCNELGGYTYPLNLDMEDADGWKARNGVGDTQNLSTIKIFKDIIEGAGKYLTLYMSKSWFDRLRAKDKALIDSIDPWLAHWGIDKPSMDCGMWQYSSDGVVPGSSARTDVNWCYKDYPTVLANMHKPTSTPVKKRYEDPNARLYVGDTVCVNITCTADYLDIPNNTVCCKKLIGGEPSKSYHWIDSYPCTEVKGANTKRVDQVLHVGESFVVSGDYKVLALDMPTDACKLKIGRFNAWVKSAYLSKVIYK